VSARAGGFPRWRAAGPSVPRGGHSLEASDVAVSLRFATAVVTRRARGENPATEPAQPAQPAEPAESVA
jgi:hypothetical protein